MNIIIVGVGNVGYTIAEVLSKYHDIMIIDNDRNVVEKAKSLLNVTVLYDDGTSPKILESSIERHSADVVISATSLDDNNLLIAMLSKLIKPSIKTIARIRNPDFVIKTSDKTVDNIFSPEIISANKLAELALLENAIDYDSIESMGLGLAIFEVTRYHKNVIGKSFNDLNDEKYCRLMAVYRDEQVITDCDSTILQEGDRLHVLATPENIAKFNDEMGVEKRATEFVIIGGGVAGEYTAKLLESRKRYVKLFETNRAKCSALSKRLNSTIIVNASGVDPHLLKGENVGRADVLIASTDTDETNLLSCLMASKLGVDRVISRYSMVEYEDIFDFTGVKTTVGSFRVVANEITKLLIEDESSILKMKLEDESFFTVVVDMKSKIANHAYGDVKLPDGCRIGYIIRHSGEKVYPDYTTMIVPGDTLILLTYNIETSKMRKLFGRNLDIDL